MTYFNELAKKFNEYFINIVQNVTRKATIKLQGPNNERSIAETIIKTYEHHPSIKLIKEDITIENNDFNVKAASVRQINEKIKGIIMQIMLSQILQIQLLLVQFIKEMAQMK